MHSTVENAIRQHRLLEANRRLACEPELAERVSRLCGYAPNIENVLVQMIRIPLILGGLIFLSQLIFREIFDLQASIWNLASHDLWIVLVAEISAAMILLPEANRNRKQLRQLLTERETAEAVEILKIVDPSAARQIEKATRHLLCVEYPA